MGLHGLIVDWLFIFFLIFGEIVIVVNWKGPRARPPRTMGGFVPMIMDTAQPSEELLFKGRAQEWTFASSLNTPWRIGSWTGRFWCQPTPARDTRGSPEARSLFEKPCQAANAGSTSLASNTSQATGEMSKPEGLFHLRLQPDITR